MDYWANKGLCFVAYPVIILKRHLSKVVDTQLWFQLLFSYVRFYNERVGKILQYAWTAQDSLNTQSTFSLGVSTTLPPQPYIGIDEFYTWGRTARGTWESYWVSIPWPAKGRKSICPSPEVAQSGSARHDVACEDWLSLFVATYNNTSKYNCVFIPSVARIE